MLNRSQTLQIITVIAFVAMACLTSEQDELFGGNLVSLMLTDEIVAMIR